MKPQSWNNRNGTEPSNLPRFGWKEGLDIGKEPLAGHWESPQLWGQTSQGRMSLEWGILEKLREWRRPTRQQRGFCSPYTSSAFLSLSPTRQNFLLENKFAGNQGHCFTGTSEWLLFIPCRSDNPAFVINSMQCHK